MKQIHLSYRLRPAVLTINAGFAVCTKKSAKFVKKSLHFFGRSCILIDAVTLIAMKREVAARERGFSVERMSS